MLGGICLIIPKHKQHRHFMYTMCMKKQAKWLPIILTIVVIVGCGYILFAKTRSSSSNINQELYQQGVPGFEDPAMQNELTAEQQKAIDDGLEELNSSGPRGCGAALTPSVHKETGAKYTFNSTCIPTGWEAEQP